MILNSTTGGHEAIIDSSDYNYLSQHKWYINPNGYFYSRQTPLHSMIIGEKEGYLVDHINGNKLDNRRENLRFVTPSQNMYNARKRENKTSIYKGVNKLNPKGRLKSIRWSCQINYQKKRVHIGHFDTEKQAAVAYDLWAKDIAGEYAKLNFPQ